MNVNLTAEQEARIGELLGQIIDDLVARFGDIETAARKVATFNKEVTA